ncbi:Ethionine resistance-conferring protein 1 [Colletotrichum siamense]|uniref:Ethionine resistance-conferring protein 1 n=1 Tax=Colletotrichum siamense TaxID=690259 RepID=A0A9P5F320_COLSI|nr:Ethionine resistance-conferring protein 1 [Colletotrichum siamense]KAF4866790.1 Ethionine resistance-conferring protein 1 [Colletotrichum siamense]
MTGEDHEDVSEDVVSRQENAPLLHTHDEPSESQAKYIWLEARLLLRKCPPLVVTYLLQFFPSVLATLIAGHLSADDLAAASIGATTIAIFGSAFVSGMATALDTLCAQSYGSVDFHTVGLHVQKMVLLMELAAVGLPAQALYEAARLFLQVQGDFHTAMLMIALCTLVNALLS